MGESSFWVFSMKIESRSGRCCCCISSFNSRFSGLLFFYLLCSLAYSSLGSGLMLQLTCCLKTFWGEKQKTGDIGCIFVWISVYLVGFSFLTLIFAAHICFPCVPWRLFLLHLPSSLRINLWLLLNNSGVGTKCVRAARAPDNSSSPDTFGTYTVLLIHPWSTPAGTVSRGKSS